MKKSVTELIKILGHSSSRSIDLHRALSITDAICRVRRVPTFNDNDKLLMTFLGSGASSNL